MGYLLYLMFWCDRRCDGCDGKFGNFVELNTPKSQLTIVCMLRGRKVWQVLLFFYDEHNLRAFRYAAFVIFSLSLYIFHIFYFLLLFFFLFPSSFHPFIFSFLFPHLLYLFIYYFVFILFPDYEPHIHNLIYKLFFYNLY